MSVETKSGEMRPKFTIFNDIYSGYKANDDYSNVYMEVKSNVAISSNRWYHCVVTFNGKELVMYLQGVVSGSKNIINGNLKDEASGNLYIGTGYYSYNSSTYDNEYHRFTGLIDEIVIYNDTLNITDVHKRWHSGAFRVSSRSSTRVAISPQTDIQPFHGILDASSKSNNGYINTYLQSESNMNMSYMNFRPKNGNQTLSPFNFNPNSSSSVVERRDSGGVKFIDGAYAFIETDRRIPISQYFTSQTPTSGNALGVSMWIYPTAAPTTNATEILAYYGSITATTNSTKGWELKLNKQSSGTMQVYATVYKGSSAYTTPFSADLAINTWHHITLTFKDNNLYLLVDSNINSPDNTTSTFIAMPSGANFNVITSYPDVIRIGYGPNNGGNGLKNVIVSEFFVANKNIDLMADYIAASAINISTPLSIFGNKVITKFNDAKQVINGQKEHTLTWGVLDAFDETGNIITANGDYFISEREQTIQYTDYEYGWWSKAHSDYNGTMQDDVWIYLLFDQVNANYIDFATSTKYGAVTDWTAYYKDENGAWQDLGSATNLGNGMFEYDLGQPTLMSGLAVNITHTEFGYDAARVQEFAPRYTEDISSDVVSMEISKVRENFDSSVPLGATAANTLNLTLSNVDLKYNPQNINSSISNYITPGVKFDIGFIINNEFIPQGTYYSDTWAISTDNMSVDVSCRDTSGKMQDRTIVDGYLAESVTAGEAIKDLALRSGVPLSNIDIEDNYVKTVLKDKPFGFWRMNESEILNYGMYFDGNVYLYSHPFADLYNNNINGVNQNVTYASRAVLPRTFYDFPESAFSLTFWMKADSAANGKTIFNYSTKNYASDFVVRVNNSGKINIQTQQLNGSIGLGGQWSDNTSSGSAIAPLPSTKLTSVSGNYGLTNPAVGYLNGKIYVGGGYSINSESANNTDAVKINQRDRRDLYVYDTSNNTWTILNGSTYSCFSDDYSQTGAVLNGKFYMCGWEDYPASSFNIKLQEFDPSSNTWTTRADFPRSGLTSYMLIACNNKLWMIGGTYAGTNYSISSWTSSTNTWSHPSLISPNYGYGFPSGITNLNNVICAVVGNKIYVMKTESSTSNNEFFWVFDTTTLSWTTLSGINFNAALYQESRLVALGNYIYLVGTIENSGITNRQYTFRYDIATDTWTTTNIATMTTYKRSSYSVVGDGTATAYAVGGQSYSNNTTSTSYKTQRFALSADQSLIDTNGITGPTTVTDSKWHHIGIGLDSSRDGTGLIITIDGKEEYFNWATGLAPTRKPSGQLLIGAGMYPHTVVNNVATAPHSINVNSIFQGFLREIKLFGPGKVTTITGYQTLSNQMNSSSRLDKRYAYNPSKYKDTILDSKPVGYWNFQEYVNSNNNLFVRDRSGYDRNGSVSITGSESCQTYWSGPILTDPYSLHLRFDKDGTTNVIPSISISNTSITPYEGSVGGNSGYSAYDFSLFPNSLNRSANFTLEFWFNYQYLPSSTSNLISKMGASQSENEWKVEFQTDGKLVFWVYTTTGNGYGVISSESLSTFKWHHIAVTAVGAQLNLYIDGILAGTGIIPSGSYMAQATPPAALIIGGGNFGNNIYPKLAEIAIYKRALPLDEIYYHYNKAGYGANNSHIDQPSDELIAYWPLNQGRFFSYEDFRDSGYAYKNSGTQKLNVIPNSGQNKNHLYAYTKNKTTSPIDATLWKKVGNLSIEDSSGLGQNMNLTIGTSVVNEFDINYYPSFNTNSPISSEIEKSIQTNQYYNNELYLRYDSYEFYTDQWSDAVVLEGWFKFTSVSSLTKLFRYGDTETSGGNGEWSVRIGTDQKLYFYINNAIPTLNSLGSALSLNEWHHIVTVLFYDVAAATYVVQIFVDGQVNTYCGFSTEPYYGANTFYIGSSSLSGYISNIAVYNKPSTGMVALTPSETLSNLSWIRQHYERGRSIRQYVYSALAAGSDSYWTEMLNIATADIGMFYFDENNHFIYEHGRTYDDTLSYRQSNVQYTLDQNQDIKSANQNVELQVNKVVVKVYPPLTQGAGTTQIWAADSGTSLAISTLALGISASATSLQINRTLNPAGEYEPLFPESGIIKINNEFIKFNKSSGSMLFDLERGYWNTVAQAHLSGSTVGESREFMMEWSGSPVLYVKYPFLTSIIFDKTVEASEWKFDGSKGRIKLYPSASAVPANKYLVLEGNNPVTKLDNYFHVAGVVVQNTEKNKQNIVEVSKDYVDNIRRYGEKILEIDNPLITDAAFAKDLAQYLLSKYSSPIPTIQVQTMGIPQLQLGDRIEINSLDRMSIENNEYWIMSISLSYNGGIEQTLTLKRVS
jgi:hypothetical protein